ncbi:MAG: arylamine N-acetyltransferase [Acidobacteriota bacterium]|nr:arylamine N-acetyltransferase [Acidobacteriota bacterium]
MAENPLAPPRNRHLLEFFDRQYDLRLADDRLQSLGALARSFSRLPYENLTKIIRSSRNGKGPSARRLPAQVLTDHRELGTGGTCFSLTATLLRLVRSLGFKAQPILADRHYGADTHSALLVRIRGRPHLLDPGYLVVEPIPLEESREVEVKTPFNRLLLSPESPGRMRLYTRQQGGRSHRLTFKTSPADPGQFMKAWDESFSWEMMTHPLLTRVEGGKQIYLNGRRLQIRTHTDVVRTELDRAELHRQIAAAFGIAPPVVRTALAILDDASRGSS